MARLKKTMDCGCIIAVDYNDMVDIIYCPKHLAALETYEILRTLVEALQANKIARAVRVAESIGVSALIKAEGK